MAHLMATINSGNYGVTASLNTAVTAAGNAIGTVMTLSSPNTAIDISGTALADAIATGAVVGTTVTGVNANVVAQKIQVGAVGDLLSGTLSGTDKNGVAYSIALGVPGQTDTIAHLAAYLNADTTLGITANLSQTTVPNDTINFSATVGDSQTPKIAVAGLTQSTAPLTVSATLRMQTSSAHSR
jgi:hypothetical protein